MLRALRVTDRFPALESRDYRRLFLNTVFASGSRWALMLARGWLVFDLTDSSAAVGLVTFAGMSPFLFAGPIGGALADRMDRRRLAIFSATAALLFSLVLAGVVLGDVVEVWHVMALAVFQGITMALVGPAQQALLPNLVRSEHLLSAVALSGIAMHGSRIIGPLLGGVLLAYAGAGYVFLLSGALLLVSIAALRRIEWRPEPGAAAPAAARSTPAQAIGSIATDVGVGIRYVWGDRRLRLVIALVVFHCGFTMAFDSMLPRLARDVGGGSETFSAFVMGIGAGAIVGTAALATLRTDAARGPVLAATGIGSGLAMLVLGIATVPAIAVLGAFLAGLTQAPYMAVSQTLLQQITPDALRGRVMSLFFMLAAGHMAFINLGFGALADSVGVRTLMIVPGLLWIAIFAAASVSLPDLRYLLRRGSFVADSAVGAVEERGAAGS